MLYIYNFIARHIFIFNINKIFIDEHFYSMAQTEGESNKACKCITSLVYPTFVVYSL